MATKRSQESRRIRPQGLALALALSAAGAAGAVQVDFEDVGPICDARDTATSRGFVLDAGLVYICPSNAAWSTNGSTSVHIAYEVRADFAQASGGSFSLRSFDAAEVWVDGHIQNAGAIRVVGRPASGGPDLEALFVLDGLLDGSGGVDDFQSFMLPPTFTSLTSVTFYAQDFTGPALGTGGFALDNIVAIPSDVAEPPAWWLTGLGLFALASTTRRRESSRTEPRHAR